MSGRSETSILIYMLKYIGFSLVSLGLSVVVSMLLINSGVLQKTIESRIQRQTGLPVQLGRVSVPLRWPLTVQIRATQLNTPDIQAQFQGARLTFRSLFEPRDFELQLYQPKVVLNGPLAEYRVQGAGDGASGAPGGGGRSSPFGLSLRVFDGEFKSPELALRNLNFSFSQRLWMKTPAQVDFSALVRSSHFPAELPVAVATDNLAFSEESIKAMAVTASVAGLNAGMQISSLLKEGRHRMILDVKAPDLSKVPAPFNLPAKDWQGSVEIYAEVIKSGPDKPWSSEGRARLKDVKANIDWKSEAQAVQGVAVADLNGQFSYADGRLSLPSVKGTFDLSQAQVDVNGILNKPPHTVLKFTVDASGANDKTVLKKMEAELWQLKSTVTGSVQLYPPFAAGLEIDIAPTPLKGVEAFLLPIKNSPVQGEIMLKALWDGPLNNPKDARIVLRNLRLKDFSADVNYDGGGAIKARGPVAATIEAQGELDHGQPKTLTASGQMQLAGLALVAGPLRKEEKQPLAAKFAVISDGKSVQIQQLALTGFLGKMTASGSVRDPLQPTLNVRLNLNPLDLSELRVALPAQRDLIPKGSVAGNVILAGRMDTTRAWSEWPLVVSGDVKVDLPEYNLSANPPETAPPAGAPAVGTPPGEAPVSEGFLPKGEFTDKLNLGLGVTVGILQKDTLTVKGIVSRGRIQNGIYSGDVTVNEVFGGKVQLSRLNVPLVQPLPTITGGAQFSGLIVQDLLEFVKPEYKTFATGRAAGDVQFSTHMPTDARFMDELTAKGKLTLQPITFNTIRVGEMINDLGKKVPGVKLPPAKLDPLKGVVRADYDLAAQAMTVSPLVGLDEDGSELNLKGKVILSNFTGDLAGHFAWAQSEVKGCLLEGNADGQGRLVIPLAIKGALLQPEVSLVADTVGRLASRALECEKTKLVEQVKKDGGKKLEAEAKKVLKGILGQ